MSDERLIKKLADNNFYKVRDLYVASIMMVTDISPSGKDEVTATAYTSYRFAIFYKPRFSKIYTRVKNGMEYEDFDKTEVDINEFYIANVCPLHTFLRKIMDVEYKKNQLFMLKEDIIEFEDLFNMNMSTEDVYLEELL